MAVTAKKQYSNFKNNERLQDYYIERLEETGSVKGAADLTNIGADTVRRLMKSDAAFKERANNARVRYAQNMCDSFRKYSPEALDTLRRVMGTGTPSAQVAAAKAILDYSLNFDMSTDIDERIRQLTEAVGDAEQLLSGDDD